VTADFLDYDLPPDRIAQTPAEPRDSARLLTLDRAAGAPGHRTFGDLPDLLEPGDLLVLNDSRVLHARVLGRRQSTGGRWEGLFLKSHPDGTWEMLAKTGGKPMPGETIAIEPGPLELTLVDKLPDGHWRVRPSLAGSPAEILARHGQVPLPPYIRQGRGEPGDADRYQTVYARQDGSVAAPTAGLHFTPALFDRLRARGIDVGFVTLHVGLGTFQPIQVDDIREHVMHAEFGEIGPETVAKIEACRLRGRRIIAVGTTSVRVLESAAAANADLRPWSGETSLFITPPYRFRVVKGLVTNFHLPRTTLLLLVAAFAGVELLRRAYETAIREHYRFYSYGDAMLIL
jgi:S-adenosylmethionine:tRNA ribosyltransferase-isomerase